MSRVRNPVLITFVFLIFATLCQAHASRRDALIFGGGCEAISSERYFPCANSVSGRAGNCYSDSQGPSRGYWNLFRPAFEAAYQSLTRAGWNTTLQYANSSWEHPWPGSGVSNRQELFSYLSREANLLVSGDELFIGIATHGSYDRHSICLGDGEYLPIEALRRYFIELRNRNVKVAVFDMSCYSGGAISELSGLGVCTMSSTEVATAAQGSSNWPAFFAIGLPLSQRVPSFYHAAHPTFEQADLNRDGIVSASEAFLVSAYFNEVNNFPISSDCTLEHAGFGRTLQAVANLLSTTNSNGAEDPLDSSTPRPLDNADIVALEILPRVARAALQYTNSETRSRIQQELALLGSPDTLGHDIEVLRIKTKAMADALYATRSSQTLGTLNLNLGRRLKTDITRALRPLIFAACRAEQIQPIEHRAQNACHEFSLF